jgi:hypothetical protein
MGCAALNMKRTGKRHLPRVRKKNLIIDELADEVLVYDLDRHKAHCLNRTAALVWKNPMVERHRNRLLAACKSN